MIFNFEIKNSKRNEHYFSNLTRDHHIYGIRTLFWAWSRPLENSFWQFLSDVEVKVHFRIWQKMWFSARIRIRKVSIAIERYLFDIFCSFSIVWQTMSTEAIFFVYFWRCANFDIFDNLWKIIFLEPDRDPEGSNIK